MDTEVYRQLPRLRKDNICPICRRKVFSHVKVHIRLHDPYRIIFTTAECNVFYCHTCALPLANGSIITEVRTKHDGLWFDLFSVNKKTPISIIKNKMKCKQNSAVHERPNPYQIVDITYSAWVYKEIKTLISISDDITICPTCFTTLCGGATYIPISEKRQAKTPGLLCKKCQCLYIWNKKAIYEILRDNLYADDFTLDGENPWRVTQRLRQKRKEEERKQQFQKKIASLREIKFAVVMICIKFADSKAVENFIIVSQKKASNSENKILHYASVEAREILSAAFKEERRRNGVYDGKAFSIVGRPIYPDSQYMAVSQNILPTIMHIGRSGGYYSSTLEKNREIVDLLVYSPFSNRYELMKATYSKDEDCCFIDIRLFRKFVKEHGNPGLNIEPYGEQKRSNSQYAHLNDESILKIYGYDVSQKAALSSACRQELLAEVIDLKICLVPKIVDLISFFIKSHPSAQYACARNKWEEDKRFVENYKVNPSRFLIANINR